MNTYTTHKPKLIITGVAVRTTNAEETGPDGRLPQLWDTYFQSNLVSAAGSEILNSYTRCIRIMKAT